ncbi:MAG: polymer-forming cytoskeletal protein, partial [Deltaproteobacteria bacterium]|nr:polymer-forming cytoskeletal protein [Deltaproteobacteria bacterium]
MSFEGKLHFENTVRIDGSFKGEISSGGTLVVGEGADIEAEIKVDTAVITGLVKGRVEASNRVELQSPCRVCGEIRTPNLIIGEGALFQGNCVML